jgi:hypothetical protein
VSLISKTAFPGGSSGSKGLGPLHLISLEAMLAVLQVGHVLVWFRCVSLVGVWATVVRIWWGCGQCLQQQPQGAGAPITQWGQCLQLKACGPS